MVEHYSLRRQSNAVDTSPIGHKPAQVMLDMLSEGH